VKKRILVVDDDPISLKIIESLLTSNGYDVTISNDAEQIEKNTKSFDPHLIIMDLLMPNVDGNEAVRRIQKDPTLDSIPLIFLTAIAMRDTIHDMEFEISVNNRSYRTLTKPIDPKSFLTEIQNILK
jgi:CheY-like chemotaxis protein